MPTIQYRWVTSNGTELVDCKIIERDTDGRFLIEFFDHIIGELTQRWVEKGYLQFPSFTDFVM